MRVDLGVGRSLIESGSHTRPSHSCDGWVCDLGVVGVPLIFGLSRGTGAFTGGPLTFVLVSGFHLAQNYCGKCHFLVVVLQQADDTCTVFNFSF